MSLTAISADWMDWIRTNLDRGCQPGVLASDMTSKGIDATVAWDAIMAIKNKNVKAVTPFVSRIKPGHTLDIQGQVMRVTLRMQEPSIVCIDNVLSDEECEALKNRSLERLKRNTTVDNDDGSYQIFTGRTSQGTSWKRGEDELFERIDQRLSELAGWPVENGEGLQVMRYEVGGQYTPHYDYFPPEYPGSAKQMERGGQRVSTVLMYLNDPEEGGETEFPNIKLKVVPKKGSAVIFEYRHDDGRLDPNSLHAGLPVLKGEKWIATRWIRQGTF